MIPTYVYDFIVMLFAFCIVMTVVSVIVKYGMTKDTFIIYAWTCRICELEFNCRFEFICFLRAKWHRVFCNREREDIGCFETRRVK